MSRPVSLYIIGYNEEANLRELLPTVTWADEILYVDSFSTDGTAALCAEHGRAPRRCAVHQIRPDSQPGSRAALARLGREH